MTEPLLSVIVDTEEKCKLEVAEEATDEDSSSKFKGTVAFQIECASSSYDSNVTVTPFLETYTDDSKFFVPTNAIAVPIVGYEVMEERARFTVYKLCVHHKVSGSSWVVYRRYTDFKRLCIAIKSKFPEIASLLPRKRWFGDNFDSEFLNERVRGLQVLVDRILNVEDLLQNSHVQEFFCLNDSPSDTEKFLDKSRVVCEALTETICHLRNQLKEKDLKIAELTKRFSTQQIMVDNSMDFFRNQTINCDNCSEAIAKYDALRRLYNEELINSPVSDNQSYSESNISS